VSDENNELQKELEMLQVYLQNLLSSSREEKHVGPGVLSSFVGSEFQVK
jgi:hypothetical protein